MKMQAAIQAARVYQRKSDDSSRSETVEPSNAAVVRGPAAHNKVTPLDVRQNLSPVVEDAIATYPQHVQLQCR